jgi:hypothetical protein
MLDFVDAGDSARQGYFPKDMIALPRHPRTRRGPAPLPLLLLEQFPAESPALHLDRAHAVPTLGSYFWDFINPSIHSFQYGSTLGLPAQQIAKLWIR